MYVYALEVTISDILVTLHQGQNVTNNLKTKNNNRINWAGNVIKVFCIWRYRRSSLLDFSYKAKIIWAINSNLKG